MPLSIPQITKKGFSLLNKVKQGGTLTFTDMRMGDGIRDPCRIEDVSHMLSPKLSAKISELYIHDRKSYFRAVFDNENLDAGFYVREVGVYAVDPDEGEILYEYSCANDNNVDFFAPGRGATIIQETIDIVSNLSNVENVVLAVDPSVILVTKLEFDKAKEDLNKILGFHIDRELEPHGLSEITADEIISMYGSSTGTGDIGDIGDAEIGIAPGEIDEMYDNDVVYSIDTGIPNGEIDEMYDNEVTYSIDNGIPNREIDGMYNN